MSELKATTAQEIVRNEKDCDYMDELFGGVKMPPAQVYLKSEADKVIADLEESHKMEVEQLLMEIVELKDNLKETREWLIESQKMHKRCADNAIKQIRHHKYKRCLAMAKWCRSRACFYDTMREGSLYWAWKSDKAYKWHKRWLELAEKFKEAR